MRTRKEIELEIRNLRREMRENGVRKISCFNGGLSCDEKRYNTELFRLQTELKTVVDLQAKQPSE